MVSRVVSASPTAVIDFSSNACHLRSLTAPIACDTGSLRCSGRELPLVSWDERCTWCSRSNLSFPIVHCSLENLRSSWCISPERAFMLRCGQRRGMGTFHDGFGLKRNPDWQQCPHEHTETNSVTIQGSQIDQGIFEYPVARPPRHCPTRSAMLEYPRLRTELFWER